MAAADASRLLRRSIDAGALAALPAGALSIVAAGKAAAAMFEECRRREGPRVGRGLVTQQSGRARVEAGPHGTIAHLPTGHPVPTAGSERAGRRALSIAEAGSPDTGLLILVSGGASAMLEVPAADLPLEDLVEASRALLEGGVPIDEINCVRKHLSRIKGGWLAAAHPGPVLTLAVSDVVGRCEDDPSVIGSGLGVADPSSFQQALEIASRPAVARRIPARALDLLMRGARGGVPETPKPGDARLRATASVIGGRREAMAGARRRASALGYHPRVLDPAVVGEARAAGTGLVARAMRALDGVPRPACLITSGETTVTVVGRGKGGRNQELALAAVGPLAELGRPAALVSVGTDGIDGPTEAAGALIDTTTLARAAHRRLDPPDAFLARNDAYAFFDALGDLVILGPTGTNVGDLQVLVVA